MKVIKKILATSLFFTIFCCGGLIASPNIPSGTLTTQLEENNLLTNIQDLRLDGVTTKVSGGIVTLYNVRALSDTTTLSDYLEIDFLFDAESLRLIPTKLEKTGNLGIFFREQFLFSKDVSTGLNLKKPDDTTLPPNKRHRLTVSNSDEFILNMETGTALTLELFDPTDNYYIVIEGPEGNIVKKSLYKKDSKWVTWGTTILESGDHIIRFEPQNDSNMTLDFSFTNNNRSLLKTLVSGNAIQASLTGKGKEYDKYLITLAAGDLLEITAPSDKDILFQLVNENNVRVQNITSANMFYQARTAGDYYLFIINNDHNNGSNYSGTITITPDPNVSLYPLITEIERQYIDVNNEFTLQISATNVPDKFNATGLPSGITIDESSGLISGVPKSSGTFSIQVTTENEYGKDTEKFLLTIQDTKTTISPLQITTLGLSVSAGMAPVSTVFSLEAKGGSGEYIYTWDFKDGNTSNQRSPSHEFVNPGIYSVEVLVTDKLDSSIATTGELTVIVSEEPTPYLPLQITSLNSSTNVGQAQLTVIFSAQATGGSGNYDFSWDFGDGQFSTEKEPTHIFTNPGTFTVSLEITDKEDSMNPSRGTLGIIVTDPPSVHTAPNQNSESETPNNTNAEEETDSTTSTSSNNDNETEKAGLGHIILLLLIGLFYSRRYNNT